jgi:hypothetical protein
MLGIVLRFWMRLTHFAFKKASSKMSSSCKNAFVRCLIKTSYPTSQDCIEDIEKNHDSKGSHYQCAFCGGWHKTSREFKSRYANTHEEIRSIKWWKTYSKKVNPCTKDKALG